MRTASQQIGWSQEAKLLYEIQRELDYVYNTTWIAAGNTTTTTTTVSLCTDADVIIGTQTWKVCNLNVDTYRNGDPIPEVTDPTEWAALTTGAWCYYNNDPANGPIYGKMYNGYAVRDPRGLAPKGYHVPLNEEWSTLIYYLGDGSIAGGKMKEIGTSHWLSPNTGATNSSGFSALPGGVRGASGFISINEVGSFHSSTLILDEPTVNYTFYTFYSVTEIERSLGNIENGYSVRLIKD